jgi:hypothetical protein
MKNIRTEKRPILGTLKTLLGTFHLLDLNPIRFSQVLNLSMREAGALCFYGLDEEYFACDILVRGDFVVVPASLVVEMDVKIVEEVADIKSSVPEAVE